MGLLNDRQAAQADKILDQASRYAEVVDRLVPDFDGPIDDVVRVGVKTVIGLARRLVRRRRSLDELVAVLEAWAEDDAPELDVDAMVRRAKARIEAQRAGR